MKKVLRKYILTLCTLLLGGYGFVHANVKEDFDGNDTGKILQRSECAVSTCTEVERATIKYAISGIENDEQFFSEETEDTSLKFDFARKTASASHYFTAPYIQKLRYLFSETQKQLIFFQHLANGSSRYLTLQVLRL